MASVPGQGWAERGALGGPGGGGAGCKQSLGWAPLAVSCVLR